jgi:hypothetical protein
MQRLLCGLLLFVVVLTGCQSATKKTASPAAPAHNVPAAVYPGPSTQEAGQASQPYPAPQGNNTASSVTTSVPYPAPGTSSGQTPVANEYAPALGDEKLTRGNASVESKDSKVILTTTSPVQVKLHLAGTLPNPCYHLRVNPAQPDAQKHIQVEVYSVTEPDKICTDVLQNFDVEISLGSFPSGHYSVYINGNLLGEFDA